MADNTSAIPESVTSTIWGYPVNVAGFHLGENA